MEKEKYKLNGKTQEVLTQLNNLEWFNQVGQPIMNNNIVCISNWKLAIKYCSMRKWEKITAEAANLIRNTVIKTSRNRYNCWNKIVTEIDYTFKPIIENKLSPIIRKYKLPDIFKHTVSWDLGHFLNECEYEDIYPNGFFRNLAYWYMEGHFPCGWTCNFSEWNKDKSNGKLIVY